MDAAPARTRLGLLGLTAALLLGAAFRLVWVEDMEYKRDEAWVYALTRDYVRHGRATRLGMPSSQNLLIPGLSLWAFYPLGHLFGVDEPTGLARGVQCASLAALLLLVLFAWRCVPAGEREWWLWAAALAAVNPLTVLFQRKIWPPSLLPLFLVAFLVCWWHRRRPAGAFGWGALGALIGQIHLGGFFYAAAALLWTAAFDPQRRRVAWRAGVFGAVLGALPMVPWLIYLATTADRSRPGVTAWTRLLEGKFYTHWMSEPLGIGLKYSLGDDYGEFLAGPRLAGRPTHGVAALHAAALLIGVALAVAAAARWRRERPTLIDWFTGRRSPTTFLLHGVFWGFGLVFTATRLPFYRHYLLVAFPLTALWLARLALPADPAARARGRAALAGLCVCNALLTAAFLAFVHTRDGDVRGDYRTPYAVQLRRQLVTAAPAERLP